MTTWISSSTNVVTLRTFPPKPKYIIVRLGGIGVTAPMG